MPTAASPDLAPTLPGKRTLAAGDLAALWVSLVVSTTTLMLAGSLVDMGMSWVQVRCTVAAARRQLRVACALGASCQSVHLDAVPAVPAVPAMPAACPAPPPQAPEPAVACCLSNRRACCASSWATSSRSCRSS